MKRCKTVSADTDCVSVSVKVTVVSGNGNLLRYEIDSLASALASGVMHTMSGAQYLRVPISEIKVK